MNDLRIAVDEAQASGLVANGQALLGTLSESGSGALGPFTADYSVGARFDGGSVDLRAPDIVRIDDMSIDLTVGVGFVIDLADFLPELCIPEICIPIPFLPDLCTPELCVDWPTIPIGPVSRAATIDFTSDFRLVAVRDGAVWVIRIEIVDIPSLSLDAVSSLIVAGLIAAIGVALLGVPFIGPFLAALTFTLGALVGIAAVSGLLGPILALFLSGLTFDVYRQPRVQQVLPAMGGDDPAVSIRIDSLAASVLSSDEDELIVDVDISPA